MHELESLSGIFENKIFRIPDYQRGYAWTTKQLTDFWEDLVNLPADRFHYTGLLSLKRVEKEVWSNWKDECWLVRDKNFTPFYIVDGQQRLTTFVIFIQAICDKLKLIHENVGKKEEEIYLGGFSLKQIREKYLVVANPPNFIIRTYKFGYEIDNPSFKFLRHKIFLEPDGGTIDETFYTLNLENANDFFKKNLQNYFDNNEGVAGINDLFIKATQKLMFNVYEIGDDFDVFVAFETMNNRGKKLSNLELLKNRLIYLITLYHNEELSSYEKNSLREKINDSWKEIYFNLGKNKQKPLNDDDFLLAHWIIYFQYTRNKGDDYIRFLLDKKFTALNIYAKNETKTSSLNEIEEIIETEKFDEDRSETTQIGKEAIYYPYKLSPREIEKYIKSLKSSVFHWYNIYNPVDNSNLTQEESLWIDRLNRIGIMYFRPLVMASFLSEKSNEKQRVEMLKSIERFIFIAFRLGRSMSNYKSSEFYRLAKDLYFDKIPIETIINRLNEIINKEFSYISESDEKIYLSYEYFKAFLDKKFKNNEGYYGWNGLYYFLYEYEMDKFKHSGNQKIDWKIFIKSEKDKVSIEHIYPQTPNNKDWDKIFGDYNDSQKSCFQGTLGNLLPLSLSINSSLQNDYFDDKKNPRYNKNGEEKRRGYSNGSHSEIEVSRYDIWNPDAILSRGKKMLKFMEMRWDLKFENDKIMEELLFLNFMSSESN